MTGMLRPLSKDTEGLPGYRSQYCGLCKAISSRWGQVYRLFLSYDFGFMAFFLSCLSPEGFATDEKRCILHPIRKQKIKVTGKLEEEVLFAQFLMVEYRLNDMTLDEKGWRRFIAIFTKRWMKRKNRAVPEALRTIVSGGIDKLLRKEHESCDDIDHMGITFGELLQALFEEVARRCEIRLSSQASMMIALMGKWVYVIDALKDLEDDVRKGRYNPLKYRYAELFLDGVALNQVIEAILNEERWKIELLVSHLVCCWNTVRPEMMWYQEEWDNLFHLSIPSLSRGLMSDQSTSSHTPKTGGKKIERSI